jgi:NADH-quinone oxidoreductase subunit H
MISYQIALGLSVVGIFMIFETLRLSDIAIAQDTTFRVFEFAERSFGATLPEPVAWLAAVRLPHWGVFLQPLAFALFLIAAMVGNRGPRFDRPADAAEIATEPWGEFTGARFALFTLAESVGVVVIAALSATIFLGGWSLPYLSQATIIAGVARFFGTGFATGFCMLLHFATFLAKLAVMIWLQLALRWSLPRLRHDRMLDLCWKLLLPLALVNLFVTGALILAFGGSV